MALVLTIGASVIFTAGVLTGKALQRGSDFGALIALGQEQQRMWAVVAQHDTAWQEWEARLKQRTPPHRVLAPTK